MNDTELSQYLYKFLELPAKRTTGETYSGERYPGETYPGETYSGET